MRKVNKIIAVVLCCVAVITSSLVFANAESSAKAAISASSSVKVGAEFTVTVKFTSAVGMGSVDAILKYNSSTVTFVSGTDANGASGSVQLSKWSQSSTGDTAFTFTLKFKAKAAGASSFTLSGSEVSDYNFGKMTVNDASTNVQVVKDTPLSTNNYLSGIKLSSGTLSPKFTKKTLSYTVNVPNATDTMRVTATCEDSKAKATVTGSGSLKVGTNTIKITVTAENGSKKTYTVKVIRAAAAGESLPPVSSEIPSTPPVESQTPSSITIYIDGIEYTVIEDYSSVTIPNGFKQTVCAVNGTQVMAVSNATDSVIMLYLTDGTQSSFFIYDTAEISYIPYRTLTVGENTYIPLSKPRGLAIPSGFTAADLKIGEQNYSAWINEQSNDFYMLYMCHLNGTPALYMYDSGENTVMRYIVINAPSNSQSGDVSTDINAPTQPQSRLWIYVSIGLGAVILALITALIIISVKAANSKNATLGAHELDFINSVDTPTQASVQDGEDASFGDDFVIK